MRRASVHRRQDGGRRGPPERIGQPELGAWRVLACVPALSALTALPQAALQPHEPPLTVLDAVHDLLEQSVLGWRCTARLQA